jgi:hypothetical protein
MMKGIGKIKNKIRRMNEMSKLNRLLKNARLRRCPHPSSLRRTLKYASLLGISGALHPGIFDQPAKNDFFNRLSKFKVQINVKCEAPRPQGGACGALAGQTPEFKKEFCARVI